MLLPVGRAALTAARFLSPISVLPIALQVKVMKQSQAEVTASRDSAALAEVHMLLPADLLHDCISHARVLLFSRVLQQQCLFELQRLSLLTPTARDCFAHRPAARLCI